jgi:hypothetical protein
VARLPAQCPSCSSQLRIRRLGCPECNTQLEGDFELPGVLQLPPEMARLEGQSYPTIRNRLNQIIEHLNRSADGRAHEQHDILDALARGELTAQQAAKLLRKVDK